MSMFTFAQANAARIPLPDKSVHSVITSPPYWGLRDYGLPPRVWANGTETCADGEHEWGEFMRPGQTGVHQSDKVQIKGTDNFQEFAATKQAFCARCGAWRGCLGLEPAPELYVAHMVAVFREIWRVLRDDGTVWLNLGSSYASGDRRSNQSRRASRVQSYGNDGIGQSDFQGTDPAYSRSGGERQDDSANHHRRNARNEQGPNAGASLPWLTGHDNGLPDSGLEPLDAFSPGARGSTIPASMPRVRAVFDLAARASAFHLEPGSYVPGAQEYAHTEQRTPDTFETSQISAYRTSGKGSLDLAYSTSRDSPALTSLYSSIASLNWQAKQLVSIPWLVALALQADGWILRCDIIWNKPNPMPESVQDRPTKSHEYVFLLAKSERYFYDAEAIREAAQDRPVDSWEKRKAAGAGSGSLENGHNSSIARGNGFSHNLGDAIGRNRRTVWTIATQPYAGSHFAVFPVALVEPMVLASTSARGCCPKCGKQWVRVVERTKSWRDTAYEDNGRQTYGPGSGNRTIRPSNGGMSVSEYQTVNWQPSCRCSCPDVVPAIVLDPFAGSGTTGRVATMHGRRFVGLDLSRAYLAELAPERLELQPYLTNADMGVA